MVPKVDATRFVVKVMVVFVTAASLGFAAFTLSLVSGGPNWKNEVEAEDFTNDFILNVSGGEKKSYAVKVRATDAAVATSSILPEVVVKAREKQVTEAKAEDAKLAAEIARIKPIIAEFKALIPPDQAGLLARSAAMDKVLEQQDKATQAASAEFAAKSASIKQIDFTMKERREEGFRLKNQLELLRTDLNAALVQQKALEDELVEVEENLKRLERREQQLKKLVEPYAEVDGK